MTDDTCISLDHLSVNAKATVCRLRGGGGFTTRLASMGLTIGTLLEVLQNDGRGPILVRVRHTRLALGRSEASRVLVGGI